MNRVAACSAVLAGVMLGASLTPAVADAKRCVRTHEIDGWRASDAKTLYVRAAQTQYYRLDLGNACPLLTDKGAHIAYKTSGSDLLCGPADWDLEVTRDAHGSLPSHCVVKTMTPLSDSEAAALPKGFQGM
ncbi:MAG: hypothetical protein JO261_05210 [Alphaproteobacteria bacterium]|nr:hypothetical protein [Alphaproteobacteria bacterium]MBV9693080.1 hypothetical protein [Alphaproteobacteria bacterium]